MSRILIDMDGILVDLLTPLLESWNVDHYKNPPLKIENIYYWDIHKALPTQDESIYDIIHRPKWFRDLLPLPGALEAIEKLQYNNECYIVSTPSGPESYKDKVEWINQYVPSFDKNHIILTGAKHLVKGDVLIDDSPANARAYKKAWPESEILTIKYPYNVNCEAYDVIAPNCKHTEAAWETILDYLL